jgi:hypothetical protein
MLTNDAMKLLQNPPAGYPLIAAASAAVKKCGVCPSKQVKAHQLLRIAVLKYMDDPKFIAYCKTLFPLPTAICGVLIQ